MADLSEFASDLFVILLYLWSMVALFVVLQAIIMMFTPKPVDQTLVKARLALAQRLEDESDLPAVFHWRRK